MAFWQTATVHSVSGGTVPSLRHGRAWPVVGWAAAAMLLMCGACDSEDDSGTASLVQAADPSVPEVYRVGLLRWSDSIEGQIAMNRGFEAAIAEARSGGLRIEVEARIAGDGVAGQERQIDQFREMVAAGVNLIVVQPTDNAALTAPLREANEAGIPVVAYDQFIVGGELAAFVTSDNRQAGTLDGEYIAHIFPTAQTLKIVLVEYPQVSSTVERVDGFFSALRFHHQPFEIVRTYQAVEPVGGRAVAERILQDFPEPGSFDVLFTVNDGGGLPIVEALAAAGRREIRVATVDGAPASLQNLREGRLTVIDAAQHCGAIGREAVRVALRILRGQSVPRRVLVPTFPVTRETLGRYGGWDAPMPEAFDKPWPSEHPRWTPSPTAGGR